jgi:hypothetical protein
MTLLAQEAQLGLGPGHPVGAFGVARDLGIGPVVLRDRQAAVVHAVRGAVLDDGRVAGVGAFPGGVVADGDALLAGGVESELGADELIDEMTVDKQLATGADVHRLTRPHHAGANQDRGQHPTGRTH